MNEELKKEAEAIDEIINRWVQLAISCGVREEMIDLRDVHKAAILECQSIIKELDAMWNNLSVGPNTIKLIESRITHYQYIIKAIEQY